MPGTALKDEKKACKSLKWWRYFSAKTILGTKFEA